MTRPATERQVLGKRLRGLREAAGLRAVDMAPLLDLDQSSISRIESGERKITDRALRTWLRASHAPPKIVAELTNLAADAPAGPTDSHQIATTQAARPREPLSSEHKRFGQRLQRLRTHAQLRSVDLARQIKLDQSSVSRVETGKRTISVAALRAWLEVTRAPQDLAADLIAAHAALPSTSRRHTHQPEGRHARADTRTHPAPTANSQRGHGV